MLVNSTNTGIDDDVAFNQHWFNAWSVVYAGECGCCTVTCECVTLFNMYHRKFIQLINNLPDTVSAPTTINKLYISAALSVCFLYLIRRDKA